MSIWDVMVNMAMLVLYAIKADLVRKKFPRSPPSEPPTTPFSTASTTITTENIQHSEYKIACNYMKNITIYVKNFTSQLFS
jgi:hypothetical protein